MKVNEILDIDEYLKGFKCEYDEIDCLYLVRNHIIAAIRKKQNKGNPPIKINSRSLLRLLKGLVRTFPYFFSKRKIWVFSNAERRKLVNGKYIDRVGGVVSDYDSKKTVFIETPIIRAHKLQTADAIMSDSFFYFFSFFYLKFFFRKANITFSGDTLDIENKYNIKINIEPIIGRFISQYRIFSLYLKFRSPSKAFFIYPDGYPGYILALKQNHIPVIELQHGIIYPEHTSYNCFIEKSAKVFRPDYILTYGEKDNICLREIGYLPSDKCFSIGNYSMWIYSSQKVMIGSYLKNVLNNIPEGKTRILVSCTLNDLNTLVSFSEDIYRIRSDYFFLILPRGSKTVDIHNEIGIVLDPDLTNVYEILSNCDVHLTISSTSAIEALYFNRKSVIYEQDSSQSFFRNNFSFLPLNFVQNATDFVDIVVPSYSIDDDAIYSIFSPSTDVKFRYFVDKILK